MSKKTKEKLQDNSQLDASPAKKPKSKARKVLSIIGNILMWAFIVFSVVITIFAFSAQSSSDGIPTIAGKVISPVVSDSMEPTINKGDLILTTKLIDDNEKESLEVGTIISFKADLDGDNAPEVNTHRIVEVKKDGAFVSYRTMGDKKGTTEEARQNKDNWDPNPVQSTDVISVFKEGESTRIPLLGGMISFLLTPTGFFVVIVIPLILFFLFEIVMFVRKILEVKGAGKKQITAEDEEMIKRKAIEEYLRAQQQNNPPAAPSEETTVPEEQPLGEPTGEPAAIASTDAPDAAPAEEVPAEETPAEEAPAEEAPAEEVPAEEAPAEEAPAEEAPAEEVPAKETPAEETPAEEAPAEEVPAEETPAEEAPAEEAPVEEAPAEEAPAEEVPAEETPAEEAPAEEAPAEEVPAEETPAEDAPAEEAPAEEAPTEEAPVEEKTETE